MFASSCGLYGAAGTEAVAEDAPMVRADTPIPERVTFDDYYIESWSLWLDIKIMKRTLGQVLRGSGS